MRKGKHNSRAQVRRPYHALCRLGTAKSTLAATLVDVSAAGIQCRVSNGLLPQVGESIYVEWQDTSAVFAEVVWIRGRQLGLRFVSLDPDYADKLDTASLGFENYSRTVAFQIAQAKTYGT
ncbi:MAG: PilZ domain-containing protein [Hyphomicrobium sp.]|nr:PilZ domain-containing protein [Hyphomicrobium sp.]